MRIDLNARVSEITPRDRRALRRVKKTAKKAVKFAARYALGLGMKAWIKAQS